MLPQSSCKWVIFYSKLLLKGVLKDSY